MSMKFIAKKYIIALICVAFTAAACGDDKDDSGSGPLSPDATSDAGDATDTAKTGDTDQVDSSGDDAGKDGGQDVSHQCGQGEAYCGLSCVDILKSTQNCGGCGQLCDFRAECVQGACECQRSQDTYCDGYCISTAEDPDNCGGCGNVCADGQVCFESACNTRAERVLAELNQVRSTATDCGGQTMPPAPELTLNEFLTQAAQTHAEDLANNNLLSNTGSDDSSPSDRVSRTDFSGTFDGEIVGGGERFAAPTVESWRKNGDTCKALMNADATTMGAGFASNDTAKGKTRWVVDFGK